MFGSEKNYLTFQRHTSGLGLFLQAFLKIYIFSEIKTKTMILIMFIIKVAIKVIKVIAP